MAIDPIKIPQNVHIEDRIVGPLTLRQVIITTIGCGFSYMLYSMLQQSFGKLSLLTTILVWIPGAVSFAFAFVRINDLTLLRLCLLLLEKMNKPSRRTWATRRGLVINIRTFSTPNTKHARSMEESLSQKEPTRIGELSAVLDHNIHADTSPAPISPLEEAVDVADTSAERLPVNPNRITVSPLNPRVSTDTVAPAAAAVSLFSSRTPSHG